MKKFLISLLLLIGITSQATELGLVTTHNKTTGTDGQGISIGTKYNNFGLSYAYFQSTSSTGKWQHKHAFTGNYTFYTVGPFDLYAKTGLAYIEKEQSTAKGWTTVSGLGTAYKLTDDTKLTLEVVRQYTNNDIMNSYNSVIYQAGIKVSF
jgi:hypothetical protein